MLEKKIALGIRCPGKHVLPPRGNPAVDPPYNSRLMEGASNKTEIDKGTKTMETARKEIGKGHTPYSVEAKRSKRRGEIAKHRKRVPGMKQDGSLPAEGVPLFSSSQNVSLAHSMQIEETGQPEPGPCASCLLAIAPYSFSMQSSLYSWQFPFWVIVFEGQVRPRNRKCLDIGHSLAADCHILNTNHTLITRDTHNTHNISDH